MSQFPAGKTVLGRITNATISSVTSIVFKDINGGVHTFAANERLIIDTIHINNRATAGDVSIFQDADGGVDLDSGEEVVTMSFAAAGPNGQWFDEGLPTLKINAAASNTFKALKSAAGAVDILVVGQVIKS